MTNATALSRINSARYELQEVIHDLRTVAVPSSDHFLDRVADRLIIIETDLFASLDQGGAA